MRILYLSIVLGLMTFSCSGDQGKKDPTPDGNPSLSGSECARMQREFLENQEIDVDQMDMKDIEDLIDRPDSFWEEFPSCDRALL